MCSLTRHDALSTQARESYAMKFRLSAAALAIAAASASQAQSQSWEFGTFIYV